MTKRQATIISPTLVALSAGYLLWLVLVLAVWGPTPTNDGAGYLRLAQLCIDHQMVYPNELTFHDDQLPFIWNPGIINLTALTQWLTHSLTPLLLLLCLLKALTALFMALTAERLFGHRVAIAALLLYAAYPNNWGQSTMISSEIPATCLALTAVWTAVDRRSLVAAGALLALANWFRPTATIFLLAILLYLLFFERDSRSRTIPCFLGGYALAVAMIGTSCYLRTGHFVYQSRSYWFSMVDECYDGAEVAPHWGQPIWPEGYPRYVEGHEQMDCFALDSIWRQRSLDWLKDHPTEYLAKMPGRLYYMYQSDYDNMTAFLADKSRPENNFITVPFRHLLTEWQSLSLAQWLALLTMLCYAVTLVMAVTGTASLIRARRWKTLFLPLSVAVGGTLLLVLVMHGETRFKDPLMPFIFILAANAPILHRRQRSQ